MAWNHNIQYHDVLLAAVPAGCERALDVGCGQGEFARLLAQRSAHVVGIDRSAEMVARAREVNADLPNADFLEADFMEYPLEERSFDFISALAVLHHVRLEPALERLKMILRPGGVLAILGLYRVRTPIDFVVTAVAAPVNRMHLLARGRHDYRPPVVPASMTLSEIKRTIRRSLPGAKVTRRLLWRYSLIWQRP